MSVPARTEQEESARGAGKGEEARSEDLALASDRVGREDRGHDGKGVCEGKGQGRRQGTPTQPGLETKCGG